MDLKTDTEDYLCSPQQCTNGSSPRFHVSDSDEQTERMISIYLPPPLQRKDTNSSREKTTILIKVQFSLTRVWRSLQSDLVQEHTNTYYSNIHLDSSCIDVTHSLCEWNIYKKYSR